MKKLTIGLLGLLGILACWAFHSPPAWAVESIVSGTLQNAATATGNGTEIDVTGMSSLGLQTTISDTATVTYESSVDGSTWNSHVCLNVATGEMVTTATASASFQCPVSGMRVFRARISAFTGGTITVKGLATSAALAKNRHAIIQSVTAFPSSPYTGQVVVVTDDSAAGACDSAAGSVVTLCRWNGVSWAALGGSSVAEADTLDTVIGRGKTTNDANSVANCVQIGDDTNKVCIGADATLGAFVIPSPAANTKTLILNGFSWSLWDEEGALALETVDPDAASTLLMWGYPNAAYRPKKSVWFGAGALSTDGTQCAAPAEVTINSGPKMWTIICTDNDASSIYGSIKMPDSYDGGTVTFEHVYIQTAADTNVLNGDIAAQCHGNGETVDSTWGTEIAIDDAAVTGSSKNDFTTSAAVTPAGTCAAGDMLYFRYQLDATGTTTAVATLHHVGFKMEYAVTSRSD